MLYEVEEIGVDTYLWSERTLNEMANLHCKSFEGREHYLPIDTVEQAIKYLTENGFKVREVKE